MSTDNVRIPDQGAESDLASWVAGDLGSAVARLYVSNVTYNKTRVPADYTEASWPGYAPIPLVFGAVFINANGEAEIDSQALAWTFGGVSGTYDNFGIYVTDSGMSKLLAVVPFLSPQTVSPSQTSVTGVLQITAVSKF